MEMTMRSNVSSPTSPRVLIADTLSLGPVSMERVKGHRNSAQVSPPQQEVGSACADSDPCSTSSTLSRTPGTETRPTSGSTTPIPLSCPCPHLLPILISC